MLITPMKESPDFWKNFVAHATHARSWAVRLCSLLPPPLRRVVRLVMRIMMGWKVRYLSPAMCHVKAFLLALYKKIRPKILALFAPILTVIGKLPWGTWRRYAQRGWECLRPYVCRGIAWGRKKIQEKAAAIEEYFFGDLRFRNERILLALVIPGVLLILALLFLFLWADLRGKAPSPELLTADKVPEESMQTPAVSANKLGLEALSRNELDRARILFTSVEGGERSQARRNLAFISRKERNFAEAVAFLDESIALEASALAYFMRGDSYRHLGDWVQARRDLETAAALSPSEPVFTNAILLLRIQAGEAAQVADWIRLQESLGLTSTGMGWALAATSLALLENNPDKAARLLAAAYASLPPDVFDTLLSYQALQQFQDHPALMPYYITSSTVRQR